MHSKVKRLHFSELGSHKSGSWYKKSRIIWDYFETSLDLLVMRSFML